MVVGDVATGTQVAVIGGGPGGYAAALRAAQLGKDVVLIEAEALGGVCLHKGCIPSKALLSAGEIYHSLPGLAARGINVAGASLDMAKLQQWKDDVVNRLAAGLNQLCRSRDVQIIQGRARFTGPRQLAVSGPGGNETIEFEHAVIATGSLARGLPGFAFDGKAVLNAGAILRLKEIPPRLLVIGGGYIGLELGTFFASVGSRVTIVEAMDRLLPGFDPELTATLTPSLERLGITTLVKARAEGWERADDGSLQVAVFQEEGGERQRQVVPCDLILVAVGRRPDTDDLGLDAAGVAVDDSGYITVDEQCRTSVDRIFAVGDVTGEPLLAHKAYQQGLAAAEAIAGLPAAFAPTAIPAVVFTQPELASVGMTEDEARRAGYDVRVGRFPFQALGRAVSTDAAAGFVKVVADAASQVVLGVQMAGKDVSTLISEAALALEMGARLEDLALTVHPHPTMGEALMEAALAAMGQPLHMMSPKTVTPDS
ncbi:MAG TPA: dihydrolipoyl dehydrogenase [Sphingobacteriaceae bacterium]|nr:dihydrolipoyl dehydrogenase [Sphingobacteriaceae bacterium]